MKILHVIRTLDPSSGGPPRVAARLAAGQAALGHEVRIITHRLMDPERDFVDMTRRLPGFEKVEVVSIPERGTLETLLAHHGRPILRRSIAAADVVHLHDVWDSHVRTAAALARQLGRPYVLQPNDSLNPWALTQKKWKKSTALALSYRRMIEGSSAVVFGHTEEERLVAQNGFRIRSFVAGLGGVYREEIEPLPEPGRFFDRVPQLRGRPFVVFLSRFHPKKGMDFLAEGFAVAARQIPDLQLVAIGHDEGAQADFESRIARHRLADRVHLLGPLHGEAKWEAYRDAVCFTLPSLDEAFTVAIIEALSCGLPVVISQACHFDDVGEYGAGFVVPLEPTRIGEAIARMCRDRDLRDEMCRNARRLYEDRLSFDGVPESLVRIYEDCIARQAVSAPAGEVLRTRRQRATPAGMAPRRTGERMRVLVNAANIRTGGGIQKTVEFVRASAAYKSGHQFSYLLSDVVVENLKRLVDVRDLRLEVAPVSPARPWRGRSTRKTLSELEERLRPDVVFSVFGPAYHRFRAPHVMGFAIPWITHPNRYAWQTLQSPVARARMWAWCRYVEFWTRFADRWVLETSVAAEGLARVLRHDPRRFHVVPNVCAEHYLRELPAGPPPDESFRKRDQGDVNLLVFSAWYPHKNLELVPRVAAELGRLDAKRRYRFFLTFDRESRQWASIESDARRLGVEDRVVNVGPIPVADGPRAYGASDALFLPTLLETYTATYPEAMATGTPIVTTDLPFARDLCGEAALYVPPNDAAVTAAALVRLAEDGSLRDDLVRRGRERASASKSPREVFEMTVRALEMAAHGARAAEPEEAGARWTAAHAGAGEDRVLE